VFPFLKCFTYSLTLLVPKQVSIYMHTEVVHEYLMLYFLLNMKFYHSTLQKYVFARHFLAMKYGHKTGRQYDFHCGPRSQMELVLIHHTLHNCLVFVHNSMMLTIFCMTYLDRRIN